jgi:hypothetical protein
MADSYKYDWDPRDWQSFALQLIRERHGAVNVQRVPDAHRGDSGLEAYSFDGCLYQCYAPKFPLPIAERARKTRAKLNADVSKLIANAETIEGWLGAVTVSRWILLVPLFDSKEPITTCTDLTEKVLSRGLAFVRFDFRVCVCDQSDFSTELEQLRRKAALRTCLSPTVTTTEELQTWQDQHVDHVQTMTEKLERGFPHTPKPQITRKVEQYVAWHLQRDNVLDQLRRDIPDLWDQVQATTSNAEKKLETLGSQGGTAKEVIGNTIRDLGHEIGECMPGFHRSEVDRIAFGTAADWLMRCPLDF